MFNNIIKRAITVAAFAGAVTGASTSAQADQTDKPQGRNKNSLTIAVPVYVVHDRRFPSARSDWNQGFAKNPGVVLEYKREVARDLIAGGRFMLGVTGGVYDNSFHRRTVFGGGIAEFEAPLTDRFAVHVGTPFGLASGYGFDRKSHRKTKGLVPMAAPYAGLSMKLSEDISVGLRAQVIPAKLVMDVLGQRTRHANAAIGSATVSLHF